MHPEEAYSTLGILYRFWCEVIEAHESIQLGINARHTALLKPVMLMLATS